MAAGPEVRAGTARPAGRGAGAGTERPGELGRRPLRGEHTGEA